MRVTFFYVMTLIFLVLPFPTMTYSAYFGEKDDTGKQECSQTTIIVKFNQAAGDKLSLKFSQGKLTTGIAQVDVLHDRYWVRRQEKLFGAFEATALKSAHGLDRIFILEVPDGTNIIEMSEAYAGCAEVEYAEPNYRVDIFQVPDDPLFDHQWYLNNTGQEYWAVNRIPGDYNDKKVFKVGTADSDIDALEVFESGPETVIPLIGIIDTGVDTDHEDLSDNIWTNPGEIPDNGIDDDHNGFVDDIHGWDFSGDDWAETFEDIGDNDPNDSSLSIAGHGTHCAGIVAAVRNNGLGISSINTPCRIMAIKIFPNAVYSVCASGIVYAADMGCDVINMSWGSPFPSGVISDAIDYAIDKGVLPVAASGNSGSEYGFCPAALPTVFTVGASNSDDEVTYFSTYGEHINVVAPGEDILSLRANNSDIYGTEGGAFGVEPNVHIVEDKYYLMDGTSMASPCVVGVAAHIIAASPGIGNDRVKEIIEQSADGMTDPYGQGDSLSIPNKFSGYGRVNLNSALQLLSGRLARIDFPYRNAIISGEISIIGTAAGDSFQSYTLEYGEGHLPDEWTEIVSSEAPVQDDVLGTWDSSPLTGRYTLRLTVGDQNRTLVPVIAENGGTHVEISSPDSGELVVGVARIYGSTIVPDFSRYILEYGPGESPTSWATVINSTRMIADDMLAEAVVSFFDESHCTFRLTVVTGGGDSITDIVTVEIGSIASSMWFYDLPFYGSLSPAVGNVDDDIGDEVVLGVKIPYATTQPGGIYVFSQDGYLESGWPKDTNLSMMSSPALGDLDRDGIDDIVICSDVGIHAYLSGSGIPDWFESANTLGGNQMSLATPIIADLENDGYLEVLTYGNVPGKHPGIANIYYGQIYAWRNNGESVIPGNDGEFAVTAYSTGNSFPCMTVADLDGDDKNEVIAAGAIGPPEGGLYIFDIDGNLELGPQDYPDEFKYVYGIAVVDLDEDENLEVVISGANPDNFTVSAFKKNGTHAAGFPIVLEDIRTDEWLGNHPAIGDLEGDGILEIIITIWTAGEARIYGWHQDGTPIGQIGSDGLLVSMASDNRTKMKDALSRSGYDLPEIMAKVRNMNRTEFPSFISEQESNPVFAFVAGSFGSPILADIDGDDRVDIIARAGYAFSIGYERIYAWDYDGILLPGYPLYVSAEKYFNPDPFSPVMSDLDKNGKLDMSLITNEGKLISWEFDVDYDTTKIPWPEYMHDRWNSGDYGFRILTDAEDDNMADFAIKYSLGQNHPNPFNPSTRIDFNIKKRGAVTLSVYNVLGQNIRILVNEVKPAGQYSVSWDGKDDHSNKVASGIYFYQLKAEDFTESRKMILVK